MKRFITRKAVAVVLTTGLVLGGGGIAYAYFTSVGSGTGSASVGTGPTGVLHITTGGPTTPLQPGGGAQPFDVTFTNSSSTVQYIGTVSLSVMTDSNTGFAETASGSVITGCTAGWFDVTPSVVVGRTMGGNGSTTLSTLGVDLPTITMNDPDANQDACQGTSIGIAFTSADS